MVIGNGMIARALMEIDRAEVVFSASGLSNAKGEDPSARQREASLLSQQISNHQGKLYVYISSYSINDKDSSRNTPYLTHKAAMESLVRSQASKYLIIRTSNVVGKSKQSGNLMNFIYHNLLQGSPFEIWTNTSRNLIDVQDLAKLLASVIDKGYENDTLYLIHPKDIAIYDIVKQFETLAKLKGNYSLTAKGQHYHSDNNLAKKLFEELKLETAPIKYTRGLIQKYFLSQGGAENS